MAVLEIPGIGNNTSMSRRWLWLEAQQQGNNMSMNRNWLCLKGQQKGGHEQGLDINGRPATGNKTSMDEKPRQSLLYLHLRHGIFSSLELLKEPCISISTFVQ